MSNILQSSYEGEKQGNWPHGKGRYTYPDGTYYEGEFFKGEFHGSGKIIYPNGDHVIGDWEHGRCVSKELIFADELKYDKNWDYCTLADRRFVKEINDGIVFYPDTFVHNPKSADLPPGTYGKITRHGRRFLRAGPQLGILVR